MKNVGFLGIYTIKTVLSSFPQFVKEKPNFCILHLRNIFNIKTSRSNISGHQYSSVSLFEVFQGLLSVTLLPAKKISSFFDTFLHVYPIYL